MVLPELILASGSPRRRELLREAGYHFRVVVPNAEEVSPATLSLTEIAMINAVRKARAAGSGLTSGVLLACDTLVALEGEILGKPANIAEACRYLARLSGRTHQVCSAVSIRALDYGRQRHFREVSHVTFRRLSDREIDSYIADIDPLDKAGAYAAQGGGKRIIARIDGSFTNVVGLPMERTAEALRQFGIVPRA